MKQDLTPAAQISTPACEEERERHALFAEIAKRYLRINTLTERGSQQLDYPDVSVVGLQRAFEAVYAAGVAACCSGRRKSKAPTRIIEASTYYIADGASLRRGERVRINALIRGYHKGSVSIYNPPVLWIKDNLQIVELGGVQSGDYLDVVHIDEQGRELPYCGPRHYPIHFFEMFDYMNQASNASK